jgi:hypothetical protein
LKLIEDHSLDVFNSGLYVILKHDSGIKKAQILSLNFSLDIIDLFLCAKDLQEVFWHGGLKEYGSMTVLLYYTIKEIRLREAQTQGI